MTSTDQVNLAHWVPRPRSRTPDAVAVRQGDVDLTYAELDAASARVRHACSTEQGSQPGDRVALITPNVVAFPVAYYAILRLGAVVVPMNPLLKAGEVAYTWNDCGVRVAVVFALFAEEARQGRREHRHRRDRHRPGRLRAAAGRRRADRRSRGPGATDDTAVILYTSGTTGTPQGRRARPRQPQHQHARLRRDAVPRHAGRRDVRRAAAVPLLRPDLRR